MIKLLIKLSFTALPILSLLFLYVIDDPFEIIRHYDNYNIDQNIVKNRDYISVETLKNNSKHKKYNSFILGNSRSLAFTCADWSKYINQKGCFHLDASGESLYGIYNKMIWLDEMKFTLDNALIILDSETLANIKNNPEHIFAKHPETIKESNIPFQLKHLTIFFDPIFLAAYIDYRIMGKVRSCFSFCFNKRRFIFDKDNNDVYFECEKEIAKGTYYQSQKEFYPRTARLAYSNPVIKNEQKYMLERIKLLLDMHGTKYNIIISPLYNQLNMNVSDVSMLAKIFGNNYVYNFSGINKYTSDIRNYYETSHYRRSVGIMILEDIYK